MFTTRSSCSNYSPSIYSDASCRAYRLYASSSSVDVPYFYVEYNPDTQFDQNESICYDLGQISYTSSQDDQMDTILPSFQDNDTPFFERFVDWNISTVSSKKRVDVAYAVSIQNTSLLLYI